MAVDAVVLAAAAVIFVALLPSNIDSDDTSPIYTGAFLVGIIALITLVIMILIAVAARVADRDSDRS
jgi:threonine/homoserine/homoserine lactone efflux protein